LPTTCHRCNLDVWGLN